MKVAALTGSIASGKSSVAAMFKELGAAVIDADYIVSELYAPGGGAAARLVPEFQDAIADGAVDKQKLSAILKDKPHLFETLNGVIHPMVRQRIKEKVAQAASGEAPLAIVEIPLLFESGQHTAYDIVVTVSAPRAVRKNRALQRAGMSEEKFDLIDARQWPDEKKAAQADFVIDTSVEMEQTKQRVAELFDHLTHLPA